MAHQSKALIFYSGVKKFGADFLKSLWEADKVYFTSSNLMCVYTHLKFQNMKFSLSVFDKKFQKSNSKCFLCQNRKSELSIDGLIISVPLLTFGVRKVEKVFCKMSQKVYPERPFEFRLSKCCFCFCLTDTTNKRTLPFLPRGKMYRVWGGGRKPIVSVG